MGAHTSKSVSVLTPRNKGVMVSKEKEKYEEEEINTATIFAHVHQETENFDKEIIKNHEKKCSGSTAVVDGQSTSRCSVFGKF